MADILHCKYCVVAYAMRRYGFEGINEKRRWTKEEESALLSGGSLDRNEGSVNAKRWRLAGGKQSGGVKKRKDIQVTKWLCLKELEPIKRGFDNSGVTFEVRERNGAYAIFREMRVDG